jgi:hypothetical protein
MNIWSTRCTASESSSPPISRDTPAWRIKIRNIRPEPRIPYITDTPARDKQIVPSLAGRGQLPPLGDTISVLGKGYNPYVQFYSVKERRMVEVPREHVRAHKYEHITKSSKRQVRYALQADYNGQRLTKFVDEATYLEYLSDDEDERRWDELFSRSQDLLAQMAKKALQDYHSGTTTLLFEDDE